MNGIDLLCVLGKFHSQGLCVPIIIAKSFECGVGCSYNLSRPSLVAHFSVLVVSGHNTTLGLPSPNVELGIYFINVVFPTPSF